MRYERFKYRVASRLTVPPISVEDDSIKRHSIVINHLGLAVPILEGKIPIRHKETTEYSYFPRNRRQLTDVAYREYLKEMMANLVEMVSNWPANAKPFKGVAIVIHGGNETPAKTVLPSARMVPEMIKDGYYPIFIHWNSWILGAYIEQLFCIRSGWYRRYAHVTGFFGLAGDIVTSLARIVPSTVAQWMLARKRRPGYVFPTIAGLDRFAPSPPNIAVKLVDYDGKEPLLRRLSMLARLPVQILVSTPAVNIVVPRAWQNLLRRTKAMFRTPREFDPNMKTEGYKQPDGSTYSPREGAMAMFLTELGKTIDDHPQLDIKVDIISHSMGAMIANEVILTSPDLPYRDLVFMAPACSVRKFAEIVSPLIRRRLPEVHAHELTLHPKLEAVQSDLWGYSPVGSVLEWLEGFLTPPNTYLDRFLGKWDNVLRTLHIFGDDVRPNIHIKAFPYDPKNRKKPYRHVHFNDEDIGFWKEEFRE